MTNKNLDLNKMGLVSLSKTEMLEIDGGDVDGLMQGNGVSLQNAENSVMAVAGFFVGIYVGIAKAL